MDGPTPRDFHDEPLAIDFTAASRLRSQVQQRLRGQETAEERLKRFAQLQQSSFEPLRSSPAGLEHFLRRNMASRRVEVIDGRWRPVSADRRFDEA